MKYFVLHINNVILIDTTMPEAQYLYGFFFLGNKEDELLSSCDVVTNSGLLRY